MKTKTLGLKIVILALSITMASCLAEGPTNSGDSGMVQLVPSYPSKPLTLRVNLTDKSSSELSEVHVNVNRMELWLAKDDKEARVIIADQMGDVDLLTLRDGMLLPLADLELSEGIMIHKIRLILNDEGNYGVKSDGSTCELQTPSAQQSGLKIKLKNPVIFENGYSYSLIMDFDSAKSVVIKGNGDCSLKPVIKLPSFVRTPLINVPDEGGEADNPVDEEPVTGGDDANDSDEGSDDEADPGDLPEEIGEEEIIDYFY